MRRISRNGKINVNIDYQVNLTHVFKWFSNLRFPRLLQIILKLFPFLPIVTVAYVSTSVTLSLSSSMYSSPYVRCLPYSYNISIVELLLISLLQLGRDFPFLCFHGYSQHWCHSRHALNEKIKIVSHHWTLVAVISVLYNLSINWNVTHVKNVQCNNMYLNMYLNYHTGSVFVKRIKVFSANFICLQEFYCTINWGEECVGFVLNLWTQFLAITCVS